MRKQFDMERIQMSNTAKIQSLPFATDEECAELRARFMRAGKIVPEKPNAKAATVACQERDFAPMPPVGRRNVANIPEEGSYRPRKIQTEAEYERRKRNYFIMLQSVLRTREELRLEFDTEIAEEEDGQA